MNALDILRGLGACRRAIQWAESQPDQSPQALWEACDDASRIAWYLGRLAERDGHGSPAHRRAVLVACLCARTASQRWSDPSSEQAVSLAERWAWGYNSVTRELVSECANYAANAAASLRFSTYADRAAIYSAAYAADVVNDAYIADYSDYAADAYVADYNDYVADYDKVRTARLASLADLIRAAVPEVPM